MRQGILVVVVALCFLPGAAVAQSGSGGDPRERQWEIRKANALGQRLPNATFLADDYKTVILEVTCPTKGRLGLRYYAEPDVESQDLLPVKQMGFERNGASVTAPAVGDGAPDRYLSSFEVDEKLLAILKPDGGEMTVDALNATDDPWFVGDAAPLYEFALTCRN